MADRTTGELPAVKVGDLPLAPDIYDDFLMPGELQGDAKHITGAQWKAYATAAIGNELTRAEDAADRAEASAGESAESAKQAKASADSAGESAERAENAVVHAPEIREGTWWVWDMDTQDYADTGVSAKGNVMYAAFFVDPDTGELYMVTDEEYTGPGFRLNENGDLEVVLTYG